MADELAIINQQEQKKVDEKEINHPIYFTFREAAAEFAKENSFSFRSRANILEREITQLSGKREDLMSTIEKLKYFKKKNDPHYSEEKFMDAKAKVEQIDEDLYVKSAAADTLIGQAQMLDNQVMQLVQSVYEREVNFIKKLKFKFEKDRMIIMNKYSNLDKFASPGIKRADNPDEKWTYDPYKDIEKMGIAKRPWSSEYIITIDQNFDKEIMAIAESFNLMMPDLLAQQVQYLAMKKMSAPYLQQFLKR